MQIGIPCIRGSFNYAKILVWTLSICTKNIKELRLVMTVPKKEVSDYCKMVKSFNIEHNIIGMPGKKKCNVSHGEALNLLFEYMTDDICGFIDCDVAIIHKGWDAKLLQLLNDKVVIVGSAYWQVNKYADFPNVIFCLFKKQVLKECGVDFRPHSFYTVQEDMADILSRPIGYKVLLDTGCELLIKLKGNGYEGKCLKPIRSYAKGAVIKARKHKKLVKNII